MIDTNFSENKSVIILLFQPIVSKEKDMSV
jgi:hypothetical protein